VRRDILLPYAVDKAKPFTVADVCCGSGVMLLAAAKQFPRWAIDSGLAQFYGWTLTRYALRCVG